MTSPRSAILLQCLSRPGPSRLASRSQPCHHCLRLASTSASPSSRSESSDLSHSSLSDSASSSPQRSSRDDDDGPVIKVDGYKQWFATVAQKYRYPPDNGPNWISGRGDYPYPTNPSFRPPAPITDSLRERIYQDHFFPDTSLAPTIAQLAAKYAVSKSRVGAILKLKAIEKGWQKEGKILQTPFQEKMERYLGCRTGVYEKNRWAPSSDVELRRQEPSYLSELAEESAHQEYLAANPAGDQVSERSPHSVKGGLDMSAFSQRDTVESDNGIERGIWEFRHESLTPSATMPGGPQELDVPYNRVFTDEATDAFEEREERRAAAKSSTETLPWEGKDKLLDTYASAKRPVLFRFVDVKAGKGNRAGSGAGATAMSTKGLGTRQARPGKPSSEHQKERRKANLLRRKAVALERIRLAPEVAEA